MDQAKDALALVGSIIALCAGGGPAAGGGPQVGTSGRPDGDLWATKAQQGVDRLVKQVAEVATPVDGLRISNLDPAVEQFLLQRALVPRGASLDVIVSVIQSAQQGALYLNLGGEQIDLASQKDALVLEIEGVGGARELSFSSGTTMEQIGGTIRLHANQTGVTATTGASGVTIRSTTLGDDRFVSVRVAEEGGLQSISPHVGIYRMAATNAGQPEPATRIDLDSTQAAQGAMDAGQDIRGIVDAWSITGQRDWLWVNRPRLRLLLRLTDGPLEPGMTANAQSLGTFRAMTITRDP